MRPRQCKILLCRLLVDAGEVLTVRGKTLTFPSYTAPASDPRPNPDPTPFVRPCQAAMPFGRGLVSFRQLLINDGNLLMIRPSARRFDFLFKVSRLDRPFGRASGLYRNNHGQ